MTVRDYLKVTKGEERLHLFLSVFFAFMGICFALSTFKFDRWILTSFEGAVKTSPVRSGRSGLVVTLSAFDSKFNNCDVKIYFTSAGYPRHPLNDLCTGDKVYVEALFHPTKGFLEPAMGIHLECKARTLYSRDRFYKEDPKDKIGSVIIAIASCFFLLYQLRKHYFHYRHLKSKRRFNVNL